MLNPTHEMGEMGHMLKVTSLQVITKLCSSFGLHGAFSILAYVLVMQSTHVHLHLKFAFHEKVFLSLISESENHILYRFITQSEIFQAFMLLCLIGQQTCLTWTP